jgi:hypothetical protein
MMSRCEGNGCYAQAAAAASAVCLLRFKAFDWSWGFIFQHSEQRCAVHDDEHRKHHPAAGGVATVLQAFCMAG